MAITEQGPGAPSIPTADLIVEDNASVGPGQMTKTQMLSELRAAICATAEEALARTGRTADGCPYIEHWFRHYEGQNAAYGERALRRFAPESAAAVVARDYIPIVCDRVRQSITVWSETGQITGVPEGVSIPALTGPAEGIISVTGQIAAGMMRGPEGSPFRPKRVITNTGDARGGTADPETMRGQLNSGVPLDSSVRTPMEQAFGTEFSEVRLHTGAAAAGLAAESDARAFTIGNDIAFGAGEYRPGTLIGDALLAHELAHVVQQQDAKGTSTAPANASNHDALEEEADTSAVSAIWAKWRNKRGGLGDLSREAVPRLKSGLRLQGCKRSAAPSVGKVSAGSLSGGVTGITMNVTATYSDCSGCFDGLEAMQVFWGTRRSDGVQVGTYQTTFPPSATTYDSFVDGGLNSPGGATYSGDHPYYIGRPDLPASYGYNTAQGSAGSVSGCTANPTDAPGAVTLHDQAFFETAIVCLNHQGGGKDKLLDAFKWGFIGFGTTQKPSPTSPAATAIETSASPSAKFLDTLKSDYPGYSHV